MGISNFYGNRRLAGQAMSELNKFVQVKLSTTALKTIDKYGLLPYLKKQGLSLSDIK